MGARDAASRALPRLRSTFGAACLWTVLASLSGCASQGPLHPPSLKLPAAVSGLAAERVGDAVDLHWTTPTKTTDGVPLAGKHGAGALVAEICRSETAAAPAAPCTGGSKLAVKAGAPADFHDVLPAPLVSGNLRALHYRVRVLNGVGKGAKYAVVDTLAGAPPPAVETLRASPVSDGVALRWQPDRAAGGARIVLRVERVAAPPGAAPPHSDLLAVEPSTRDPGGAIDTGAKPGVEQRYTVFRTDTLRSGGKNLTVSSLPATVTVLASAKAPPPPPPAGLEGLVNTLGAPEIDLVWQPVDGAAGYLVFRAEGDTAVVQLTPRPVTGLSYADAAVRPGVRYRYSVASVDASGASGAHGPELVQSIPQP